MSTLDAKSLELIASKICHDLISPIGAINNGLEIFEEMGADSGMDVTELIASSARVASAKLQAYRLAYGAGGSDSTVRNSDAHASLELILEHEKRLTQDWDANGDLGVSGYPKAFPKMLLAFLLLAMDCLPKGGVLSVSAGENGTTKVIASGEATNLRDGVEDALRLNKALIDLPTSATHAYMTGILAQFYSYELVSIEDCGKIVTFSIKAPEGSELIG